MTDHPVALDRRFSASPSSFGFLPRGTSAPIRRAGGTAHLRFEHRFQVNEPRASRSTGELQTVGYRYEVLDADEREIVAFHWHPVGVSPITYPHLHLSGRLAPIDLGPREEPVRLGEMHLPTGGMVTLADVVRLLISEFGVVPRRGDWERILAEAGG